jgi:hypothetical protein
MDITNDNGVAYKAVMLVSNFAVFGQHARKLMRYGRQKRNAINPQGYIIHKEINDSENDSMT